MGIIPKDELKRMGLCRESLLSRDWHNLFPTASRSLLNFDSFDECLGYIAVLFPKLREEIAELNRVGAQIYVSRKRLSPLEQCILCRVSPKIGIYDEQIGFIYGIKKPAVAKIKKKWMPQWGYAGKMLTDLSSTRTMWTTRDQMLTTTMTFRIWGLNAMEKTFTANRSVVLAHSIVLSIRQS
jgi:hypothetical protein